MSPAGRYPTSGNFQVDEAGLRRRIERTRLAEEQEDVCVGAAREGEARGPFGRRALAALVSDLWREGERPGRGERGENGTFQ